MEHSQGTGDQQTFFSIIVYNCKEFDSRGYLFFQRFFEAPRQFMPLVALILALLATILCKQEWSVNTREL